MWQESLNSDGHQFHQYQQNEQSPLTYRKFKQWWSSIPPISTKQTITFHLNWTPQTQKRPWHMTLKIQVLSWNRHKIVAGLNWLVGSQPSHLDFQHKYIYMYKQLRISGCENDLEHFIVFYIAQSWFMVCGLERWKGHRLKKNQINLIKFWRYLLCC